VSEVSSTLIGYEGILDRQQLALVHTPAATATHRPVPHHEVIQALVETLGFRKIAPVKEQYAVSKDGMKLFGTMELETTFHGCRFALGIRNSHNKTLALGITVGYRVMVCENLAFHGDYTPVMRKHTRNFNLADALSIGVDNIQRNFEPMVKDVERWQDAQLTDASAKLLIYEAFVEGGMELPKHLMRPTHDYYFQPPHDEFAPRTVWSLNNAFSGASKALEPIPLQRAASEIGQFFNARKL
jgi:hypothetical protein